MNEIKKTFSIILVVMLTVAVSIPADAGNRSGTVSGQFLKIPTGARAIAMGGAQVAVAEGVNSMAYNPAGILVVNDIGVGLTYTAWFAGIQHSYAGIVKNLPGIGAVGVGVVLLTTDDMIETTTAFPEGTGRTFRASDYALNFSYGRQVTDQFRVGLNGKIIQSYLYNKEVGTSTFAFDIGTLYDIPILQSHIGVSLTNIGKDLRYLQETYSLPTALRFGILVDVMKQDANALVTTLQVARLNDADEQYNVGAEYLFNNVVALRGGYKFNYDQEDFTGGFGVRLNSIGFNGTLDYGFNNFKFLPGTHTFTFEFQF